MKQKGFIDGEMLFIIFFVAILIGGTAWVISAEHQVSAECESKGGQRIELASGSVVCAKMEIIE